MGANIKSKMFSNVDEELQRCVLGQQRKYALYRDAIKEMFGGDVSKIGELESDMENKSIDDGMLKESPPLVLYKYMSPKALKGLLRYGELKVSYRHDANDPFEMTRRKHLPLHYEESHSDNIDLRAGFISFTKNDNDPAMWGNYADKYGGARVMFEIPYYSASIERLRELLSAGIFTQGCYVAVQSKLAKLQNIEAFYYRLRNKVADGMLPICIFNCRYHDSRYQFVPLSNRTTQEGKSEGLFGENDLAETFLALLTYIENEHILEYGTKHSTWRLENEYRTLIPDWMITRIEHQETSFFLTSEFSKYIKAITLGPKCPISETEARILVKRQANLSDDVKVNRAAFNRESFYLDIPDEYKDGNRLTNEADTNELKETSDKAP